MQKTLCMGPSLRTWSVAAAQYFPAFSGDSYTENPNQLSENSICCIQVPKHAPINKKYQKSTDYLHVVYFNYLVAVLES